MTFNVIFGQNTIIQIQNLSSTYLTINGVTGAKNFASGKTKDIPGTVWSSPIIVTYPGLPDMGEAVITLERNQDDPGQQEVWNSWVNGQATAVRNWQVILSSSSNDTLSFTAYVKSFATSDIPVDGIVMGEISIKINSQITYS
jgi:hypothetical protein